MTHDEQDTELGRMVRERRSLMTEIACLDSMLYRASESLNKARAAIDRARDNDYELLDAGLVYPAAEESVSRLTRLKKARSQLAEINKMLDGA